MRWELSSKERIAAAICRRRFPLFWQRYKEDALQEARAAAWAHRDLEGVSLLRAVYRDLYAASLSYAGRKSSTGNGGTGEWYLAEVPALLLDRARAEHCALEERMALRVYGLLLSSRAYRAGERGRLAAMRGAILFVLTEFCGEPLRSAAEKVGLSYQAAKQARLRALRTYMEVRNVA